MANKECQEKLKDFNKENIELKTEIDNSKSQIFRQNKIIKDLKGQPIKTNKLSEQDATSFHTFRKARVIQNKVQMHSGFFNPSIKNEELARP